MREAEDVLDLLVDSVGVFFDGSVRILISVSVSGLSGLHVRGLGYTAACIPFFRVR